MPDAAKAALRKRHNLADDAPVEFKTVPMEVVSSDGHKFKARITTNTLDRDGEVMHPAGMDATEFDKVGAIFWNHNYDLPVAKPVGKMIRTKGFVDSEAEFATRPDDYQGDFFPDFARAMVQQGIVKGVSIGFIPIESRMPSKKDIEEYGDGIRRVHSKFKLLEWSIAPVQCNPDAMIRQAISKGIINEAGELIDPLAATPAEEAKSDDTATKTTCPDCGAEMDGDTCAACAEKKTGDDATVTDAVEEALDAQDDGQDGPVKRVVRTVEAPDEEPVLVKRVHRILDTGDNGRSTKTVKHVMRTIKKLRGAPYA